MLKLIRPSRCQGVSLIEVLVAIIIISVGMLGLVAMQMTGMRQTTHSGLQTHAMMLADDLIDRMRANRRALFNGTVITDANYGKPPNANFPTTAAANCATATGCPPADMAQADLTAWARMVANSLPVDATLLKNNTFVCLDGTPGDANPCDGVGSTFVIQLAWYENNPLDNSTIQTYRMVFEP